MKLFSKLLCILLATFLLVLPFFGCDTTIDTNDPTDDVGETPTPDAVEPTEAPNTPEVPPAELVFGFQSYPVNVPDLYIGYRDNDALPQLEYAISLQILSLQLDAAKVDIFNQLQPPATLRELELTILSLDGDTDIELDMSKFSACKGLTTIRITLTDEVYVSKLTLPDTGSEINSSVFLEEGSGIDLTGCAMLSKLEIVGNTAVTLGSGAEHIQISGWIDLSTLESTSGVEIFTIDSNKPEIGQAIDLSLLPDSVKELRLSGEGFDLSKLIDSSVARLSLKCPDITDLSALVGNNSIEHLSIHDKYINDISASENIPSIKTMSITVYPEDTSVIPRAFLSLLGMDKQYTAANADVLGDVDYLNIPIAQLKTFAKGEGRILWLYSSNN